MSVLVCVALTNAGLNIIAMSSESGSNTLIFEIIRTELDNVMTRLKC